VSDTPKPDAGTTRREFVGALGAAAVFALPVLAGDRTAMAADGAWVATLKPEELPPDSFRLYRRNKFVLSRQGDVVRALTIICTHQQCDLNPGLDRATKSLLVCKCHGGQFDATGKVVKGPPNKPLKVLAIRLGDGGVIEVDPTGAGDEAGLKVK
jgi:cytochrome b6-f complex iron-sulfur subunit